jgi:pantetheine-phosphate adenylyltransferase
MKTAVVAGTFDPPTNGHLDVIQRTAAVFERVIVAVGSSSEKRTLFSAAERVEMLREACAGLGSVEVEAFEGLLVDFAERRGAAVIVKGLRCMSDFDREYQMAFHNRGLKPGIETVFLMASPAYSHLRSSVIREIAGLGGSAAGFVPPAVERRQRLPGFAGEPGQGREGSAIETTVDILKLIDALEDLVEQTRWRMFHRVYGVDEDAFFTLTNKLRASLPEEVKTAARITRDSERILADAQDRAERIITDAKEQAALLVSNDEITRQAQRQAQEIIRRAQEEARQVRGEVTDYSRQVLANLEGYAARVLAAIQQGKERLEIPSEDEAERGEQA